MAEKSLLDDLGVEEPEIYEQGVPIVEGSDEGSGGDPPKVEFRSGTGGYVTGGVRFRARSTQIAPT